MIPMLLYFVFSIFQLFTPVTVNASTPPTHADATIHIENVAPILAKDADLQKKMEKAILSNPQWKKLINSKRMSIGLVDMRNPAQSRFASLNGNHMMYAASLPKIAVLLAAEEALEDGSLKETPEVLNDMRIMISKSNNQATTRMIDRVGFDKIASTMTNPSYKLYDKTNGGGLWVGKRYAAGGKRNPDPLKGISHAATVKQVCRFYHMLANDQLVSPERSAHMRKMMINPDLHHKFVNVLDRIAPTAKIYRKSGSWKQYHADSVWVKDQSRNYILVALIDDEAGGSICKDLVYAIEGVLNASIIKIKS